MSEKTVKEHNQKIQAALRRTRVQNQKLQTSLELSPILSQEDSQADHRLRMQLISKRVRKKYP